MATIHSTLVDILQLVILYYNIEVYTISYVYIAKCISLKCLIVNVFIGKVSWEMYQYYPVIDHWNVLLYLIKSWGILFWLQQYNL